MGDTGASGVIGFFVIVAILVATGILSCAFLLACFKRFGRASRAVMIVSGLLLIPVGAISAPLIYSLVKADIARRENDRLHPGTLVWAYGDEYLNSVIDAFYNQHSDTFSFPNNDEAAQSPELLRHLLGQPVFTATGFTIKDDDLFSPSSDKIALAVDKNRDHVLLVSHHVIPSPWKDDRHQCALLRFVPNVRSQPSIPGWIRLN